MRIVVTGASGNIGSALLRRLAGAGHEVVGVARRLPGSGELAGAADWVRLDLSTPAGAAGLGRTLRGATACVHLAWALQPMHQAAYQRRVNLGGSAAALGASLDAGVRQFVAASSIGAYAPRRGAGPVDESYPVTGNPKCEYSRQKAVLEGLIADMEPAARGRMALSSVRPALVGQRAAGSAFSRIGVSGLVPSRVLTSLGVVPLARGTRLQVVHADDVAEAIARILEQGATGPFNLVAEPVLGRRQIAEAMGARPVPVPERLIEGVTRALWHTRLQPLDPGWLNMAHRVPLVSSQRARDVLGWAPSRSAQQTWEELVTAMRDRAAGPSPALRERTARDDAARLLREGPPSDRQAT